MKCPYILLAFSALICCALFAGCTSPSEVAITPVETTGPQTATTAAVTSPPTPITTLDLVVTLPPEQFVDLQLTKDRTDGTIHLLYNGGMGEGYVQSIRMVVTLSDGTVINRVMDAGQKPRRGDEIIIVGSRGSDRSEVYVTSSGKEYKVIDESIMSYRY
ncbi:MAG: hypothetical protein ABFC71_10320 [Methanoregula sp.]